MSYGDNAFKRKGIELEEDTCQMILRELRSKGHIVSAEKSTLYEDMVNKIDRYLVFDYSTPFHGMFKIPIDIKVGDTYTVINGIGENTLESSESEFIIFRFDNKLHWAPHHLINDWVERNSRLIRESFSGDGSKYIKVRNFPYFNIF